jgi:hypothetical protein
MVKPAPPIVTIVKRPNRNQHPNFAQYAFSDAPPFTVRIQLDGGRECGCRALPPLHI